MTLSRLPLFSMREEIFLCGMHSFYSIISHVGYINYEPPNTSVRDVNTNLLVKV